MRQSREGPWIKTVNKTRNRMKPVDFGGTVTVVDPLGKSETVVMNEVWAKRTFPIAEGVEMKPFAAPEWANFIPSPVRGDALEPLELRGHLNFVFYADTARTIRFRGGLREPERPSDRVADIQFRSIDDLVHRPLAKLHPEGDRTASFSFDAPAPGWYVLYAMPGRNGFYLTGCDAPIYFSLGKSRTFDPTMPCVVLGVE